MSDLNTSIDDKNKFGFQLVLIAMWLPLSFLRIGELLIEIYYKGSELPSEFVFQMAIMHVLSPLIVLSAIFKLNKWQISSLIIPVKNRLILVGHIWFLSSLFVWWIINQNHADDTYHYLTKHGSLPFSSDKTFMLLTFEYSLKQVLVWGDFELIIFPLFIGIGTIYNHGWTFVKKFGIF